MKICPNCNGRLRSIIKGNKRILNCRRCGYYNETFLDKNKKFSNY